MGINIGSAPISDIKIGSAQVDKVYVGSTLAWEKQSAIRALRFVCAGSQGISVKASMLGTISPNFEYSLDEGATWTTWDVSNTISFGNGTDLLLRGMNTYLAVAGQNYTQLEFSNMNNPVDCYGNVMHLFDYTQDLTAFPDDANYTSRGVKNLFSASTVGFSPLRTPPSFPATSLAQWCYWNTFAYCRSMTSIPELPATVSSNQCYSYMFTQCNNIKMSLTQTGEYQNEFTMGFVPSSSTADGMFDLTGGTWRGTPAVQTLYTSNSIVSAS